MSGFVLYMVDGLGVASFHRECDLTLWYDYWSQIKIKECSSTLYVGLQHVVPPTNTKFTVTAPDSNGYAVH